MMNSSFRSKLQTTGYAGGSLASDFAALDLLQGHVGVTASGCIPGDSARCWSDLSGYISGSSGTHRVLAAINWAGTDPNDQSVPVLASAGENASGPPDPDVGAFDQGVFLVRNSFAPIPVPAALPLFGSALLGLLGIRYTRR